MSVDTSTHEPPHAWVPAAHAPHTPWSHVVPGHAFEHAAQWAGSVARLVHTPGSPAFAPGQKWLPVAHAHLPPVQATPAGHTTPQPPQLAGSASVGMQTCLVSVASRHAISPAVGQTHFALSLHERPSAQVAPSAPVHTPPQPSAWPHVLHGWPAHVGAQPTHCCVAGSHVVPFATQSTHELPPEPHTLGRLPGAHSLWNPPVQAQQPLAQKNGSQNPCGMHWAPVFVS